MQNNQASRGLARKAVQVIAYDVPDSGTSQGYGILITLLNDGRIFERLLQNGTTSWIELKDAPWMQAGAPKN